MIRKSAFTGNGPCDSAVKRMTNLEGEVEVVNRDVDGGAAGVLQQNHQLLYQRTLAGALQPRAIRLLNVLWSAPISENTSLIKMAAMRRHAAPCCSESCCSRGNLDTRRPDHVACTINTALGCALLYLATCLLGSYLRRADAKHQRPRLLALRAPLLHMRGELVLHVKEHWQVEVVDPRPAGCITLHVSTPPRGPARMAASLAVYFRMITTHERIHTSRSCQAAPSRRAPGCRPGSVQARSSGRAAQGSPVAGIRTVPAAVLWPPNLRHMIAFMQRSAQIERNAL